jgi:hypothetical protein
MFRTNYIRYSHCSFQGEIFEVLTSIKEKSFEPIYMSFLLGIS